jgi:hypothetical protein
MGNGNLLRRPRHIFTEGQGFKGCGKMLYPALEAAEVQLLFDPKLAQGLKRVW